MPITEFSEKVDVVARYRAAAVKLPPTLVNVAGKPMTVEVEFAGAAYDFTLDGSEMEKLLAKFGVASVKKLFQG